MQKEVNRLHTQELKRRTKLAPGEKMKEWKQTREGKRQFKKL